MSESSWCSDEEWTTIAAMVCDTQDNGSNAVEGDTEDGSSVTNRQQIGSNDTQGTNATATVDDPGNNDTHIADEQGNNDTPMVDKPGINDTPPLMHQVPMTHLPLINQVTMTHLR